MSRGWAIPVTSVVFTAAVAAVAFRSKPHTCVIDGSCDGQATITAHSFYTSTPAAIHNFANKSTHLLVAHSHTVIMCGADCFLMLLSVLFPPIGGT